MWEDNSVLGKSAKFESAIHPQKEEAMASGIITRLLIQKLSLCSGDPGSNPITADSEPEFNFLKSVLKNLLMIIKLLSEKPIWFMVNALYG